MAGPPNLSPADIEKAVAFYSGKTPSSTAFDAPQEAPAIDPKFASAIDFYAPKGSAPSAPSLPVKPTASSAPSLDPTFGFGKPKDQIDAIDPAQALAALKGSRGTTETGAFGLPVQSQATKTLAPVDIEGTIPPKTIAPVTITGQPTRAGGGGVPANPDPYGVKADQKAMLGTFDTEKGLVGEQGHLEASKALHLGDEAGRAAREKQEDAAIMNAEAAERQRIFDQHIEETQRQLDEVRQKKIEPFRMLNDSGAAAMTIVGGALGGAYMGLNHMDHNPFIDDLNKTLDRDMQGQRENLANQKEALQGRMSLLTAMRDHWKDDTLAKLQARNLGYEATKEAIMAEAQQYDLPIIQNRAEQAVNGIDRAQIALKTDIDKAAEQQAAAAAGAAAAQARADAKTANERIDKIYTGTFEKLVGEGTPPAEADRIARHAVATLMSPNGAAPLAPGGGGGTFDPVAAVPKDQRHEASEEQKRAAAAEKAKEAVRKLYQDYENAPDLPTITGGRKRDAVLSSGRANVRAALGEGFSSDKDTITYVDGQLPKYGEPAEARQTKLRGLLDFIDQRAQTPTLDRYSPGWRAKDKATADAAKGPQRFDANGKPIP